MDWYYYGMLTQEQTRRRPQRMHPQPIPSIAGQRLSWLSMPAIARL